MMFKILILQRYYNLSDDQTEYQIFDRLSFMRFLDLKLSDKLPDSKTIWLFRETLIKNGVIERRIKKQYDLVFKNKQRSPERLVYCIGFRNRIRPGKPLDPFGSSMRKFNNAHTWMKQVSDNGNS